MVDTLGARLRAGASAKDGEVLGRVRSSPLPHLSILRLSVPICELGSAKQALTSRFLEVVAAVSKSSLFSAFCSVDLVGLGGGKRKEGRILRLRCYQAKEVTAGAPLFQLSSDLQPTAPAPSIQLGIHGQIALADPYYP